MIRLTQIEDGYFTEKQPVLVNTDKVRYFRSIWTDAADDEKPPIEAAVVVFSADHDDDTGYANDLKGNFLLVEETLEQIQKLIKEARA